MTPETALPVYSWWDNVPDGLKTKTQLAKEGFKPGGPVRARIEYPVRRRRRSYDLYDQGEAIAKQATPQQLAALEKARIAVRTCSHCGTVVELPSQLSKRTGRCADCIAKAAEAKRAREVDATIEWARRMLATEDVLILDTETTDLHGYVVEIGIIRIDGTVVYESLVNPRVPIRATHIHGISDRMVWNAPTFAEIEPELRRLLHGRTVVVYNAPYDAGVLESEVKRLCTPDDEALAWLVESDWGEWGSRGLGHYWRMWQGQGRVLVTLRDDTREYLWTVRDHASWWRERVKWECAMEQYAVFYGDWNDRYRDYNYQALRGGHRAVGDCLACLEVIKRMAAARLSTEQTEEASL